MMSTFRSASPTLGLFSEPNARPLLWRFWAAARTYWSAAADALRAARAYEEMTRRGATHAEAVERIFDRHLRAR